VDLAHSPWTTGGTGPRWTKDKGAAVGSLELTRPGLLGHWWSSEVAGEEEWKVAVSGRCSLDYR
jgi:hypothetical protein